MKENEIKEQKKNEDKPANISAFQKIREENEKNQKQLEEKQQELLQELEQREKQRREAYEKKLIEEKKELMRLKQGVIEESELIPDEEEEHEIKMTPWAKIKSFFYLNKWWLGLACFAVLLGGYLIHDLASRPHPDMVVLLIGKYPSIGENSSLSDYVASFADDFNKNGKTEVDVYYIDTDEEGSYSNYAKGSDTKLSAELQIADAVMVIADTEFNKLINPDEVFIDLSEMYNDNEHVSGRFFRLKGTDFAKNIGVSEDSVNYDTYIAVRAPKRVMYASAEEMQETFDKDMPVIDKIIQDLSK